MDTHLGTQPMSEYTYGALGAVPMIVAFWPVVFGGAYAANQTPRSQRTRPQWRRLKQKAKDGIVEAIDAAVRKIEETEGPGAADRARKANDRGPSRIMNRKIAVTGGIAMENHGIIIPTKDKLFNLEPLLTKTPGNIIITWIIPAIGLFITIIRFTVGIGSVTNLTDYQPWGLWIGF